MISTNVRPPLTPIVFEILLSLLDGARHGYDIMQQVEERTQGKVRLLPGTLYRAMHRLIDESFIEETENTERPHDDRRRVYYRLTASGRDAARAEAERLEATLNYARSRNLLGDHGVS